MLNEGAGSERRGCDWASEVNREVFGETTDSRGGGAIEVGGPMLAG